MGIVRGIVATASTQFKGTDAADALPRLRVVGAKRGEVETICCTTPIEPRDMIIITPTQGSVEGLVIQLAEVYRVVHEDLNPYIVVRLWHPVMKEHKFENRVNRFGAWTRSAEPYRFKTSSEWKAGRKDGKSGDRERQGGRHDEYNDPHSGLVSVPMSFALAWPIRTSSGETGPPGIRRCGAAAIGHL